MNERIKLLAEQAELPLIDVDGRCKYGDTYFDKEKFAELIVRECMKLCTEVKDDVSTIIDKDRRELAEMAATFCYEAIKDEFGVEE